MKNTFYVFAAILVALMLVPTAAQAAPADSAPQLVTVPASILAAPASGQCTVNAEGDQVCYDFVPAQYTDPTTACPEGSTPIEGDPDHCFVDTSGYVYADRPTIPATYVCPEGYEEVSGGEKPCAKVKEAGHYDTQAQPYEDVTSCPGPFTFTADRWTCPSGYHLFGFTCKKWFHPDVPATHEVFGPITVYYDKSNDPNKCHMRTGSQEDVPSWAMHEFNDEFDEWIDSTVTRVYAACSTLGADWEDDPAVAHQCRKWINATYDWADKVVGVPEHLGDCPTGYTPVAGSDTSCQKYEESGNEVDVVTVGGTAYCDEGDLVDGQCRVVVDCPVYCPYEGLTNLLATDLACKPPETGIPGCMKPKNENYDPNATIPDDSYCHVNPPSEWCTKLLEGRPDQPDWKKIPACVQWMKNSAGLSYYEAIKLIVKGLFTKAPAQ